MPQERDVATIGFVPHPQRPEAVELAVETASWLDASGHKVRLLASTSSPWDCNQEELTQGLDLAVSLGGDGTMLRAVDLVLSTGVPVLGVDVGHLGYLTEVGPHDLRRALSRFLEGDYRIEERMTLAVDVHQASDTESGRTRGPGSGDAGEEGEDTGEKAAEPAEPAHSLPSRRINALNDAVVQRTPGGHTVRLAATVNGDPFLTYAADSMIVATPTGSTAYNLSARGPIVSPRARVLVMTPVAAHMLFDRALILSPDEGLRLQVIDGRQAELVVDGQTQGFLATGDVIQCMAGPRDARLVSFGGRDFHHILKQKFGLSDR
jgi:NAD+ kinase